jgi:predicted metalloprotease with PDZ domain
VNAPPGTPIRLHYRVDLGYAEKGDKALGQAFGDALYLSTRPLFIASAEEPATVRIVAPSSWHIATPWDLFGGTSRIYRARTVTDLELNSLVIGNFREKRMTYGPLTLTLALPGRAGDALPLVAPPLERLLKHHVDLFPGTPRRNYLMTFYYSPQDDGEAFYGSAAFTARQKVDPAGKLIWANFLSHELLHFWNAQTLRPIEADFDHLKWFTEGATEYLANAALVSTGIISRSEWERKAETQIGMYNYFKWSPVWRGLSIRDAGSDSGRNRPGLYNGGWTASLCLDAELRQHSGGKASLASLLTGLYEQKHEAGFYTEADLISAARALGGPDIGTFFSRYISGTETLPVDKCLAAFGLRAFAKAPAGEAYISEDSAATAVAREQLSALFN